MSAEKGDAEIGRSTLRRFIRREQDPGARMFIRPSSEARRLARHLGWLFAPAGGKETWLSRTLGALLVAPFTQLTLFSFDLQAFLYEVFHQRPAARIGHFVFMPAVNFFVMAGLAKVWFGTHPAAHHAIFIGPNLGTAYAALLLVWYALLAHRTRMRAWALVMVPVVLALCVGANLFHALTFTLDPARRTFFTPSRVDCNPWLGALVSAAFIALSHVPEARLPPRVTGTRRWVPMREYVSGVPDAPLSPAARLLRVLLLGVQFLSGTLNEFVASPRLMPYGFLMLMLKLGYRPAVDQQLRDHVARAIASGNPAIDYVGTGGGAQLDAERLCSEPSLPRANPV